MHIVYNWLLGDVTVGKKRFFSRFRAFWRHFSEKLDEILNFNVNFEIKLMIKSSTDNSKARNSVHLVYQRCYISFSSIF